MPYLDLFSTDCSQSQIRLRAWSTLSQGCHEVVVCIMEPPLDLSSRLYMRTRSSDLGRSHRFIPFDVGRVQVIHFTLNVRWKDSSLIAKTWLCTETPPPQYLATTSVLQIPVWETPGSFNSSRALTGQVEGKTETPGTSSGCQTTYHTIRWGVLVVSIFPNIDLGSILGFVAIRRPEFLGSGNADDLKENVAPCPRTCKYHGWHPTACVGNSHAGIQLANHVDNW